MLNPQTIGDLAQAFESAPGGFLVVDSGRPRFAVLTFETYQSLKSAPEVPQRLKRILVTGGAGYIGSVTARLLRQNGYEVIIYDNFSTGRRENVSGYKVIEGDLADRALLDKVFREEQIDAVMHFAAFIDAGESVRQPDNYFQNNVVNGLNLLDAMVAHKVGKLVFSSSAAVYGDSGEPTIAESSPCSPTNPYGDSKLIFEKFLRWYGSSFGLDSVSLRYFNAAGAWPQEGLGYANRGGESHLIPRILDAAMGKIPEIEIYGQDYATPDRTCVRDYVHVLDLAEAHLLALKKLQKDTGVHAYNVGTGQGHSVLEVIENAVEITGRMIAMKFGSRRLGDPAKLIANSSKLGREFSWRPKYGLKEILETSWDWHQRIGK